MPSHLSLIHITQEYFHLKEPYQFKHSLAGCTDSAIIKEIVTEIKGRCTSGWAAGLMLTYEMKMKRTLKTHKGYLMPNVAKTLEYIKENVPDITNLLMTGNTTGGARDKVTHYGIVSHFDFRHSSYGDLAEERDEVARILYYRLQVDLSLIHISCPPPIEEPTTSQTCSCASCIRKATVFGCTELPRSPARK